MDRWIYKVTDYTMKGTKESNDNGKQWNIVNSRILHSSGMLQNNYCHDMIDWRKPRQVRELLSYFKKSTCMTDWWKKE